jgi:PAS domain S-box-containing protein
MDGVPTPLEPELLSYIASFDDSVSILDTEGRIIFWNHGAEILYGHLADDVVGRNIAEIFPNSWDAEHVPNLSRLAAGEHIDVYTTNRIRKDGVEIDVSIRPSALRNQNGELIGVSVVSRDVSDRRRREREHSELANLLLRIEEDVARSFAIEIHDGPLQTLIASRLRLQMVQNAVEQGVAKNLESISAAISETIEQLRSIMFSVAPPVIDDGNLIESLQEYFERFHDIAEGTKLIFDERERLVTRHPAAVALYRIGREAIANALKHAGATEIRVEVTDESGGLQLRVRDNGKGMSTVEPRPGHLGLNAMLAYSERLGGWTRISSAPLEGTTVTAWIPST